MIRAALVIVMCVWFGALVYVAYSQSDTQDDTDFDRCEYERKFTQCMDLLDDGSKRINDNWDTVFGICFDSAYYAATKPTKAIPSECKRGTL